MNYFNFKFIEISAVRLSLFGHGAKPLGHALLDEIFPLFFIKKILRRDHPKIFNAGLLIGIYLLINSILGIFTSGYLDLYQLHIAYISILLMIISQVRWKSCFFDYLTLPACLYLGINVCFVIAEQSSFIEIGVTASECRARLPRSHDCWSNIAFWQNYWTGTAYSSLGLWLSAAIILKTVKTFKVTISVFILYMFIATFQMSKAMILGGICLLPLIIRDGKQIAFIFIFLFLSFVLETVFWTLPVLDVISNATELWFVARLSYTFLILDYFQNGLFDPARWVEVTNALQYFQGQDVTKVLFGNFTGFHRLGLHETSATLPSVIYRPIGLLIWVVDYGLIFLFLYLTQMAITVKGAVSLFAQHRIVEVLSLLFVTILVFSYPLVTNVDESILFWFLIFHPTFLQSLYLVKRD